MDGLWTAYGRPTDHLWRADGVLVAYGVLMVCSGSQLQMKAKMTDDSKYE